MSNEQCDDGNFCTVDQCSGWLCVNPLKDGDGDGFIDLVCGGNDCNDSNNKVYPGAAEQCADGLDNDCNGLSDCGDQPCFGSPQCACDPNAVESCDNAQDDNCNGLVDCNDPQCNGTPQCVCEPFESNCGDGQDDNCNGLIDCGDPQCFGQPGCVTCSSSELKCADTSDDDCDGLVDCADPDCAASPTCACGPAELCGNGKDDDCNGLSDCLDPACAANPICACQASETLCGDGQDNDCDNQIDCEDNDCFADPLCTCNQQPESCNDGQDNNCNDLIDCADPACVNTAACQCNGPPQAEVCNDNQDNDCDGLVDCADSNCLGNPACVQCKPEVCNDNQDNNCNGFVDCADPACAFDPNCAPKSESCNNKIDDDLDGKVDCADEDCKNNPFCELKQSNCQTAKLINASGTYTGDTTGNIGETKGTCGGTAGEAVFRLVITAPTKFHVDTDGSQFDTTLYLRAGSCQAGKELACNDDSVSTSLPPPAWPSVAELDVTILYPGTYFLFVDGYTIDVNQGPNQGPYAINVVLEPNPKEICNDGLDNDGDVHVDCADSNCTGEAQCQCNAPQLSGPEFGVAACTDGIDNDCDGKTDSADKDCNASDYYATEVCDGVDNNGNQIIDDFSCRCANDGDCGQEQICYGQSSRSCGPPCNQFVGNVCPFVAPGSTCNPAIGQCVFP